MLSDFTEFLANTLQILSRDNHLRVSRLVVQIFRQTTDLTTQNFQNHFSLDRGNRFQNGQRRLNLLGMDC